MKYREIRIKASPEELDGLLERLATLTDADLQITDPRELDVFLGDGTSYEWNYVDESVLAGDGTASVSFYLEESEELSQELKELLERVGFEETFMDDSLWMDNLQGNFIPTRYGKHVIAKPEWAEYAPEEGDIVLEIDPGQAFGTGTSPTTALALELLEKYMRPGLRVLDVGCGTGILALLAAKMGASSVKAVDIDPLAEICTNHNIELNQCKGLVTFELRDLVKGLEYTADLVAANLTVDILQRLLENLDAHTAEHCCIIASGIIRDREQDGIDALEKAGFRIVEKVYAEEWIAAVGER